MNVHQHLIFGAKGYRLFATKEEALTHCYDVLDILHRNTLANQQLAKEIVDLVWSLPKEEIKVQWDAMYAALDNTEDYKSVDGKDVDDRGLDAADRAVISACNVLSKEVQL